MTIIFIYLTVTLLVMYSEAMDTYRVKAKYKLLESVIFSLSWPISLPLAIYSVWKELK